MSNDELLQKGMMRLHWAEMNMPVLQQIRERFKKEKPLKGYNVAMALHVEAKTGILAIILAEAGAKIRITSCNPLSTDDSVALALKEKYGLEVFAKKGETQDEYYSNLNSVLDIGPDFIIDDGADLIAIVHSERTDLLKNIKGANEETTTGVIRLRSLSKEGKLKFPVMAVNDAKMKYLFDNRYGMGQSAFDGWMNATNLMISGKRLVIAGYGWCGKGIAMRAKGLGASVIVCEVDPICAIEAKMDGFEVMPMIEAVKDADIVMSVTGCNDIVRKEHLKVIKDGCMLANLGHFDNEINKNDLKSMAKKITHVREFVDEYDLGGKKVFLIAEGRLMNLAAGQGHPAEIMDMSFAVQLLSLEYLVKNHDSMKNEVYNVPAEIDKVIAECKLKAMNVKIDSLSDKQRSYISGWQEGT